LFEFDFELRLTLAQSDRAAQGNTGD